MPIFFNFKVARKSQTVDEDSVKLQEKSMKILKLYRIINMSCWDYFHVYTFQRSPF